MMAKRKRKPNETAQAILRYYVPALRARSSRKLDAWREPRLSGGGTTLRMHCKHQSLDLLGRIVRLYLQLDLDEDAVQLRVVSEGKYNSTIVVARVELVFGEQVWEVINAGVPELWRGGGVAGGWVMISDHERKIEAALLRGQGDDPHRLILFRIYQALRKHILDVHDAEHSAKFDSTASRSTLKTVDPAIC